MMVISTFEIFFVIFSISIIGNESVNCAMSGKIVGGMNTEVGEFPFMVSLIRRGRHFCGATIVSENFLVTAAHCLCSGSNKLIRPSTVKGLVGAYRQTYYGKTYGLGYQVNVKSFIIHPGYDCLTVTDDIALLELENPLKLTDDVQKVNLKNQEEILPENASVTVMGWGWDNENFIDGSRPEILQKAAVNVISNERCQKSYQENNKQNVIVETQLCAGRLQGGVDACWADSGGPLIDEHHTLVGIVSTGVGCARPFLPGIYTRVSKYLNWIENAIETR